MKPKADIDRLVSAGDFQRTYNWSIRFAQVPNVLRTVLTSEEFNLRCIGTTLPTGSNEKIEINNRGVKLRIPGIYNYGQDITTTMLETTDSYTRRIVEIWRQACWSAKEGKAVPFEDVVGVLRIDLLEGDHDVLPTSSLHVHLAWLVGGDFGTFGGENQIVQPKLTFAYSYYTPVV